MRGGGRGFGGRKGEIVGGGGGGKGGRGVWEKGYLAVLYRVYVGRGGLKSALLMELGLEYSKFFRLLMGFF